MTRALAIWLGAGVLLLLVLVAEWLPGGTPQAVSPRARTVAPVTKATPVQAESDVGEWVDTILARPLFSATRKPTKMAASGKAYTGPGIPRLAGIMIFPGSKRAIFMPDGGKPLVLAEGAALGENVIRSIAPDHVVIGDANGAGRDQVLKPTLDKQHLPPVAAPLFGQPGGIQPGAPPIPFQPPAPQFISPPQQDGEAGSPPNPTPVAIPRPAPPILPRMMQVPPRRE